MGALFRVVVIFTYRRAHCSKSFTASKLILCVRLIREVVLQPNSLTTMHDVTWHDDVMDQVAGVRCWYWFPVCAYLCCFLLAKPILEEFKEPSSPRSP